MKKRSFILVVTSILILAPLVAISALTRDKPKEPELIPKDDLGRIHLFDKETGDYVGFSDPDEEPLNLTDEEIKELENSNDVISYIGITQSEILERV